MTLLADAYVVNSIINLGALIALAAGVSALILPLHPRLPGWAAWQGHQESEESAERLLRTVLGDAKYEDFIRLGYIEIPSRTHPGRVYMIRSWPGKVTIVEGGQPTAVLCAQPIIDVPMADLLVLHKLMIEGNEDEYLRTANQSDIGS